jgi:hypothetical protein
VRFSVNAAAVREDDAMRHRLDGKTRREDADLDARATATRTRETDSSS